MVARGAVLNVVVHPLLVVCVIRAEIYTHSFVKQTHLLVHSFEQEQHYYGLMRSWSSIISRIYCCRLVRAAVESTAVAVPVKSRHSTCTTEYLYQ